LPWGDETGRPVGTYIIDARSSSCDYQISIQGMEIN
jgi:hypothetical protein